jgi:hypothetical protein
MKKQEFKKGDGVLGTNTTKEQRAEILKYAHENGYNVYTGVWTEEDGYVSSFENICFNGKYFMGYDDSHVTNPMTYPEIMIKINPEWLIGKKCKGFKFESTSDFNYSPDMDDYIGKISEIKRIDFKGNILMKFDDDFWVYPLSEIHKHLVLEDEPKLPYIPEKYEKALFWDNNEEEAKVKEFLCYNERSEKYPYVVVGGNVGGISFKNCKPLSKIDVREYYFSSKYYSEGMGIYLDSLDTHKITIEFQNGEPICESIKMEKL